MTGIGCTVAWGGGKAGALVEDVEIGKAAGVVGVAAASKIGYRHNRSSHTERTVRQEVAVAGLAEEGSIENCKFRNQAAERDFDSQQTSKGNNPPGEGVEGEDQEAEVAVADCTMVEAKKDFFA